MIPVFIEVINQVFTVVTEHIRGIIVFILTVCGMIIPVMDFLSKVGQKIAMVNGFFGFIERFIPKKFVFWKAKKATLIEETTTQQTKEIQKNEIFAIISPENIAVVEEMEVVLITQNGTKLKIEVRDLSDALIPYNFAFLEEAKAIQYIRLKGILYQDFRLVEGYEFGHKIEN